MRFYKSRPVWTRFAVGAVIEGLVASGVIAGCSSSSQSSDDRTDAQAICPATIDDTNGRPCGVPALTCSPQYVCGALVATVTCTCGGGRFSCIDATGQTLSLGQSPACPAVKPTAACPPTETAAKMQPCTEPGLLCAYPSTCPEARGYDVCECFAEATSAGAVELRFACSDPCPNVDAALPLPDAQLDSAVDATVSDADASTDAHPIDGAQGPGEGGG